MSCFIRLVGERNDDKMFDTLHSELVILKMTEEVRVLKEENERLRGLITKYRFEEETRPGPVVLAWLAKEMVEEELSDM